MELGSALPEENATKKIKINFQTPWIAGLQRGLLKTKKFGQRLQ